MEEIVKEIGSVHFLSDGPVVRTSKETIKSRAGFDVSWPFDGPSLNWCLYPGLNLLGKNVDILARFHLIRLELVHVSIRRL